MIKKKKLFDTIFFAAFIFFIHSIIIYYQTNLPPFMVSDYDYHWNSLRTASSILNIKESLLNFDFPALDYYKNFGHNSLFQVIPTLNPIYLFIFITDVENVLLIQKITENFIAMLGVYFLFRKVSNDSLKIISLALIYVSFGYFLNPIVFLTKDFFYLPFFLFFLYEFLEKKSIGLFVYLIILNLVSNWSGILLYPTISFFFTIFFFKKNYVKLFCFPILIFISLPLLWLPIVSEIIFFSNSNTTVDNVSPIGIFENLIPSIFYLYNSGIDSFFHPYNGTIGPLYIPIFVYLISIYFFLKFNEIRKYYYILIIFVVFYFIYFLFFSTLFNPMKIRHHLTLIPYIILLFFYMSILKFNKKISNKFIFIIFILDFLLFFIVSFREGTDFIYQEQNFIKINSFFNLKSSYLFPIINSLILIFLIKRNSNILSLITIFFLSVFHLSTHSSWLNKFESRAQLVGDNFKDYYRLYEECSNKVIKKDYNSLILLNSNSRLNDKFIMISNLNKKNKIRVFPEYEETNSSLYGLVHAILRKDENLNFKNLLNKDLKNYSKASNLGYFQMKEIVPEKISLLKRLGVSHIVSDIEITGLDENLVKKCINFDDQILIYEINKSPNIAFLSRYKLQSNISDEIFFNKNNFKTIKLKNISNNINLNFHNSLKFNYLYILINKSKHHKLKINNKNMEFLNIDAFDDFIVVDLNPLNKEKIENININIEYDITYLYIIVLLYFSSVFFLRKFY